MVGQAQVGDEHCSQTFNQPLGSVTRQNSILSETPCTLRSLILLGLSPRRTVQSLCLTEVQGFILNVPSRVSLGIVSLPLKRRHWLAVCLVNGQYYNLDSKLKNPVCIGGEAELRWVRWLIMTWLFFLSQYLHQSPALWFAI